MNAIFLKSTWYVRTALLCLLTVGILTAIPALPAKAVSFISAPCPFGSLEVPLPVDAFEGKTICDIVDGFNNDPVGTAGGDAVTPLRSYAAVVANIIIAAIIGLGLVMTVVGGYIYMTAGGAADRVNTAKKIIGGALLGIILALSTFVILNTINPEIVGRDPAALDLVPD